jgi:hypothetical protein
VQLREIPRVRRSELKPHLRREPRVVVDSVATWPALKRWEPTYLKRTVGDREVAVRETDGPPSNIFQNLQSGGWTTFGEYLDWVLENARDVDHIAQKGLAVTDVARFVAAQGYEFSYYLDAKLHRLSGALADDVRAPDWFRTGVIDVNFWCGVFGTSCGLHCDVTPNCNVQVVGRKNFSLFAPTQARRIYRKPQSTHCRFDPNRPDFEQFPLAAEAEGWACTLEPGESLYIPVGWYHQATVVSGWAVNVNFFWRRPFLHGVMEPALWPLLLRRSRMQLVQRLKVLW